MAELSIERRDWSTIQTTADDLERFINEIREDKSKIVDCFILSQVLNNRFDYYEKEYKIDDKGEVSSLVLREAKDRRDDLYNRFYKNLRKLTKEEIVRIINEGLHVEMEAFKKGMMKRNKFLYDNITALFDIRDRIKVLYEELSFWLGQWVELDVSKRKYKFCFDESCSAISKIDEMINLMVKEKGKDYFVFAISRAKERMILKPDGTVRFNYWWWYIGENN